MTCPRCSAEVPASANFCPACAAPVSEAGATILASRHGVDPTMTLGPTQATRPTAPASTHEFDTETTLGPMSPFDSAHRRHTAFSQVVVAPLLPVGLASLTTSAALSY